MSLLLGRERLEHRSPTSKFACPLAASGLGGQVTNRNSNGGALRLAVLIDGENVPAKDAGLLFAKVTKLGNPIIRRVYGDFTKGNVKDWPKVISQHGGSAHQNGHTSAGKNASDIALVVDAMDFLHKRSVDGFFIVTADGDFTSLAKRAREDGFKVFCFAHSHAAKALKAACDGFFPLAAASPTPAAAKPPANSPAKQKAAPPNNKVPTQNAHLALPLIGEIMAERPDGSMSLGELGKKLRAKDVAYLKKAGFGSLKKLITKLPSHYELGPGVDGKTEQVRRRP